MARVRRVRRIELVAGETGSEIRGPPTISPPYHAQPPAAGGAFSAFPAPLFDQAPAPLIPQTGPR